MVCLCTSRHDVHNFYVRHKVIILLLSTYNLLRAVRVNVQVVEVILQTGMAQDTVDWGIDKHIITRHETGTFESIATVTKRSAYQMDIIFDITTHQIHAFPGQTSTLQGSYVHISYSMLLSSPVQ